MTNCRGASYNPRSLDEIVCSAKNGSNIWQKMNEKVFISYGHEDHHAAKRLFGDLQRAGFQPWLDRECLLGGQKWEVAVRGAIRESRFFIALLSMRSVTRKGFLHAELKEAIKILKEYPDSEKFIIPVRLDDCKPAQEELSELHRIDVFPDWNAGVSRILKSLALSHQAVKALIAIQFRRLNPEMFTRFFTSATGREFIMPGYDKPPYRTEDDPLFDFLFSCDDIEEIHWVHGSFDILVILRAQNVVAVGEMLDRIRKSPNVLNTSTSILLGRVQRSSQPDI